MKYLLPLEMFYKWEKEKANEIYLSQPINGVEHAWTWSEFGIEVRKMATYLKSLNCLDFTNAPSLIKRHGDNRDLNINLSLKN